MRPPGPWPANSTRTTRPPRCPVKCSSSRASTSRSRRCFNFGSLVGATSLVRSARAPTLPDHRSIVRRSLVARFAVFARLGLPGAERRELLAKFRQLLAQLHHDAILLGAVSLQVRIAF